MWWEMRDERTRYFIRSHHIPHIAGISHCHTGGTFCPVCTGWSTAILQVGVDRIYYIKTVGGFCPKAPSRGLWVPWAVSLWHQRADVSRQLHIGNFGPRSFSLSLPIEYSALWAMLGVFFSVNFYFVNKETKYNKQNRWWRWDWSDQTLCDCETITDCVVCLYHHYHHHHHHHHPIISQISRTGQTG